MAEHGEQSEPGTRSGPARPDPTRRRAPDPFERPGNTVEQALRRLSFELASLRAERDGLRVELAGVRAECERLRQQLAGREGSVEREVVESAGAAPIVGGAADTSDPSEVERFFDQPGVWIAGPERRAAPGGRLRTWAQRLTWAALVVVVAGVLVISVGPRVLPYQTFFVRSGSMEPAIDTGSMIFLTNVDASDLERGDIITFERPDEPGTMVTHRILAIETSDTGRFFRTKGDANGALDPWRVPASGTAWKYAFDLPKIGYVFRYLGTDQARLALLAIPAVLLGLLSLVDIRRPIGRRAAPR